MAAFRALVLAGSRGEGDPLARAQGVAHRALLDVSGVPMLLRVVRTLQRSPGVGRVVVSIDEPEAVETVPELAVMVRSGELAVTKSLSSPSRSVLDVIDRIGLEEPLLVTTADHALLSPEMVEHFLTASSEGGPDVAIGFVGRTLLQAAFPESTRTYLPFRDDHYSGANLFAFRTRDARRAAEFWVRAESFRKRPWRLVSAFGPLTLLLFLSRRLDLDAGLARASRVIGARIAPVRLPFPEAAIDVDRPSDLALVNRLLEKR